MRRFIIFPSIYLRPIKSLRFIHPGRNHSFRWWLIFFGLIHLQLAESYQHHPTGQFAPLTCRVNSIFGHLRVGLHISKVFFSSFLPSNFLGRKDLKKVLNSEKLSSVRGPQMAYFLRCANRSLLLIIRATFDHWWIFFFQNPSNCAYQNVTFRFRNLSVSKLFQFLGWYRIRYQKNLV